MKIFKVTPNAGRDSEKLGQSDIAGRNVKWVHHSGKQFGSFFFKFFLIVQ